VHSGYREGPMHDWRYEHAGQRTQQRGTRDAGVSSGRMNAAKFLPSSKG